MYNFSKVYSFRDVKPCGVNYFGGLGKIYANVLSPLKFRAHSLKQAETAASILFHGFCGLYSKSHKPSKKAIEYVQEIDYAWDILDYCKGKKGKDFINGLYMCFFNSLEKRKPLKESFSEYFNRIYIQ